jgi:hypothetical protein
VISCIVVSAQDKNPNTLTYELEFAFSGEISPKQDSIFKIYCVLNISDLANIKNLEVYYGQFEDRLNVKKLDLNDKKIVTKRGNKVLVEIGLSDVTTSIIKLSVEDIQGKIIKADLKK